MQESGPETGRHNVMFVAPHRPMFLAGGVMLLVGFTLWAIELGARIGLGSPVGWTLPGGWMHALLVSLGVFPFFIFGFLFTAMPRWQGMTDLPRPRWLRPWMLLAGGWALVVIGLLVPGLLAVGLLTLIAGWIMVVRVLWDVAHQPRADRLHARMTCWGVIGGGTSLLAWLALALTGDAVWARVAINLGVWCFLVPVFASVCHRMIPFFSSGIIPDYVMVRPRWALGVLVGASVVHGLLVIAGFSTLTWLVDLPAALVALWLSYQWRLLPALKVRLLGMLHIGFAWLGIAFLLFAIQGIAAVLGHHVLGMAPLHVLGLGYFGSILLAMVSRVTLGHSGRPLQADRLTWGLFLGLQVIVLLRVLADVVPWSWSGSVMFAAALGWLGIFMAWASRYLPIYVRPRVDGKAG
ncbi:MAG TPA: NnrS family protein [Rhodocyclaceae bacterium]|nr:NnrS family protein [Rhodocyclaceae bacterium]HRQ48418.1 NnrS family protein [Rhodocyclaceae bacterium]